MLFALAFAVIMLSLDGERLRRLAGRGQKGDQETMVLHNGGHATPSRTLEFERLAAGQADVETTYVPAASEGESSLDNASSGYIFAQVMGAGGQADVFLNGLWKGVAPLYIGGVEPGTHEVAFRLGGETWKENVQVMAGDTTKVAYSAPEQPVAGQLVVRCQGANPTSGPAPDSVLVDGRFVGLGGLSLEVSSGYHSVSFLPANAPRSDFVVYVPPGSVQYVSAPQVLPPFSVAGVAPVLDESTLRFQARLSSPVSPAPELSLVVLSGGGSSLKVASMPRGSSAGEYAGAVSLSELPLGEVRYFYRARLPSGEEIDSPVYSFSPNGPAAPDQAVVTVARNN